MTPADRVVALLERDRWTRIGIGPKGTLWRSADGDKTVAVPNELTPDSYEWAGIMARIRHDPR